MARPCTVCLTCGSDLISDLRSLVFDRVLTSDLRSQTSGLSMLPSSERSGPPSAAVFPVSFMLTFSTSNPLIFCLSTLCPALCTVRLLIQYQASSNQHQGTKTDFLTYSPASHRASLTEPSKLSDAVQKQSEPRRHEVREVETCSFGLSGKDRQPKISSPTAN